MRTVKELVRKLHLFLGLVTGTIVFIVAVTGSIYCFEEELRSVIYSECFKVKNVSAVRTPVDEILKKAQTLHDGMSVKNIRIRQDSTASVEVIFKNKLSVFIDPYTGEELGSFNRDSDFFGTVLKIHRTLLLGETGKIITGTSAMIFIFMLITGIVLWWPNKKNRKQKFTIMRNAQRPKKLYDLHSVLGFYASWIILFTAVTGIIWSFKWAEGVMYSVTGSKKTEAKKVKGTEVDSVFSFENVVLRARHTCPEGKDLILNLPDEGKGDIRVNMIIDKKGIFRRTDQFFFSNENGQLKKTKLYSDLSAGDKMKAANYTIHTGKALGLAGQFLVFFAALITASLPVTGFLMWRGKRRLRVIK